MNSFFDKFQHYFIGTKKGEKKEKKRRKFLLYLCRSGIKSVLCAGTKRERGTEKMFTCIACSKQPGDEGEEEGGGARGSGTPSTKEAVKSLTAQVPYPTPSLSLSFIYKNIRYIFPCLSLFFAFVPNLCFFSIIFHICENKQNQNPIRWL